jgi:2-deoxy-D-gluconate 3-dehydrogenase
MKNIFEQFSLQGQAALVTGGAGLLGREFCRTLAQAGATVIIADVQIAAARQVAEDLQAQDLACLPLEMDVTSPDSVSTAVQTAMQTFGRLDILVNSAALDPKFDPAALEGDADHHSGAFETFPLSAWQQALEVNLTGMFLTCQAAGRAMLAQGHGVMINLCSMYGLVGPDQRLYQQPDRPARYKPVYYSVTKAGVLGLTRYLATYYAGQDIRVNALTPGGVDNNHDESFLQAYAARSVLGRMARKDELNGALLFLASPASAYMTGANLVVDGGWTAW